MYVYLVYYCQNPECPEKIVLKYLGEDGKVPENIPIRVPPRSFMFRCPTCNKEYNYSSEYRHMYKSYQKPKEGFVDLL